MTAAQLDLMIAGALVIAATLAAWLIDLIRRDLGKLRSGDMEALIDATREPRSLYIAGCAPWVNCGQCVEGEHGVALCPAHDARFWAECEALYRRTP